MADKFKNKYRIDSARARWHDYNEGTYFITICTANMEHYFGKIAQSQMHLSEIGQYAHENFQNVTQHYKYAEIPLFVIMPNHIHAIVIIADSDVVEIRRALSLRQKTSNRKGKLSVVIGGLKSAITKFANENNIPFKWQTSFYDRIIRNNNELNNVANYIENNVAKWDTDKYFE